VTAAADPCPVADGASGGADRAPRQIRAWLLVCALLVFAILVVGGITRLTHSGLSIVRWQPLSGALPPLSDAAWTALFDQYRASPEFRLVNGSMTLGEFKPIFWWEYAHRLLGRIAAIALAVPLLVFWITGRMPRALAWRLLGILALGALQGALGWYMVASGLVDDPRVSPVRLAAHLGMALLIIGLLLWTAWTLPGARTARMAMGLPGRAALLAVFLMALSGALMAGTHAGYAYNTFPLMDGHLLPPELFDAESWSGGFLENLAAVQVLHRMLAVAVVAALFALWRHARSRGERPRRAARILPPALVLQLALGIATLCSGLVLPLAAAHQAGAVILFACTLWVAFSVTRAGNARTNPRVNRNTA
jgi:cytochrome c oxidase assembly protein subunit 15